MNELTSLNGLNDLIESLPVFDEAVADKARARQSELTKPPGSLGRLENIVVFLAGWQGVERPRTARSDVIVFAGNHGVCAQGVNPYPQAVTKAMVANFKAGGAAINQISRSAGATLKVVALEIDRPTIDFTTGPAMTAEDGLIALNAGIASINPDADILCLGEMGIGNSTVAAALAAGAFGGGAAKWVGPGTGSDATGVAHKADVIEKALTLHAGMIAEGIELLCRLGGREQAAICGAVLAARRHRIPVLLDGFICTAAVAPLHVISTGLLDHCLVAHASAEPGHAALTAALGKDPILDLGMRLGEGSGAALALSVVKAAVEAHNGMATFEEAGIGA